MKKLLIIEDDSAVIDAYRSLLSEHVEIVVAKTISEADRVVFGPDLFDAAIIDACICRNHINTIPFVKELRRRLTCPMIAGSSDSFFNDLLVEAGCSHKASKYEAAELALRLLA
jgi:DNA-binding NtrC family response regulator